MGNYFKTTLVFAWTQIKRSLRDPMTLLVLCAIPPLLLLIFGTLLRDVENNISLRVAVVNNSSEQFATDFGKSLEEVGVFKQPEASLKLNEAKDRMNEGDLDGIIELPEGFGAIGQNGAPSGTVKVYFDATDNQTGDLVSSVMRSVVDETNKQLTDVKLPLDIAREPVNISQVKAIDSVFSMFTGLAIVMVGLFGVASVIPYDKKGGYLRRLRATPMRPGQFILGTMLNYLAIGVVVVTLMTVLAIVLFDFSMRGSWLTYGAFVLFSLVALLGFGLAVGGIAKNTTQADILGQIIFLISMAFGGVWFPRALMPEFIQNITSFMPLTAVIDGIRAITVDSAALAALAPEIGVLAAWGVAAYAIGIKSFKWE